MCFVGSQPKILIYNENRDRTGLDEPAGDKRTSSLSEKVRDILENLPKAIEDEYAANGSSAGNLGAFPTLGNMPTAAEDPDLDILPMLTNDFSGNLWELFDSPLIFSSSYQGWNFPGPGGLAEHH
ncbi:uncharacterized protein N7477_000597 [Penicillium maclennaniae]|uniref:uncharacterized protein n=1 Tax=Penicillium maclennaniae TaxID=1343394 RepID=UPI002540EFAC|nr:uncharacterized protein N7477_000597 [Penicillium maclennaniae]KAJ5684252.1 hypothetical protein N7477_000597 [Penicillium maclennaniae]